MSNFNCDDTFIAFKQALANVNVTKNVHGSLFEIITESEKTTEFENANKEKTRMKKLAEMCNKIKDCKKMQKAQKFVEDVLINLTNVTPETFNKVTKLYELCEANEDTTDEPETDDEEELEPEIKEELDHYIKIYKVDGLSTFKILESMIEFLKWLCIYGKNADRELAKQFKEELEDKWLHKFSELVDADPETGDEEQAEDDVEEPVENDVEEPVEEPVEDDSEEPVEDDAEEPAEEPAEDDKE